MDTIHTLTEQSLFISIFDACILFILVISGLISFLRGFTSEALSLLSLIAAIVVTIFGVDYLTSFLRVYIQSDFMATGISYAFIGIISLLIFKTIAQKIGAMIRSSAIGLIDRSLGMIFGLIRGLVIFSFTHLLASIFVQPTDYSFFKEAKSRPLIEYGSSMLSSIKNFKNIFKEEIQDIKNIDELRNKYGSSFPSKKEELIEYKEKARKKLDEIVEKVTKEK